MRPLWRSISALVELSDGDSDENIVESVVEVVVENVVDGTVEVSASIKLENILFFSKIKSNLF